MKHSFKLSEKEIAQVVQLLSKLEPGYLPFDIFMEIYRLTPAPVVQVIPFRQTGDGKVEVLMIQRPADDPVWPDLWHNPGTVIRSGDTNKSAIDRLLQAELKGTKVSVMPTFAEICFNTSRRGSEVVQIYWIEVVGDPKAGKFWPIDNLPANSMNSDVVILKKAYEHYKSQLPSED